MNLRSLDTKKANECQFVEDLYINAFPPEERRPIYKMYNLYSEESPYNIDVIEEGEVIVGFITYWDFDSFVYVEHFSISGTARNSGFGKKSLELFLTKIGNRPVVLEVELDTNDISERRINFYKRTGFTLWKELSYAQPPYVENGSFIPMYLMTWGDIDTEKHLHEIKNTLYEKVYGVVQ